MKTIPSSSYRFVCLVQVGIYVILSLLPSAEAERSQFFDADFARSPVAGSSLSLSDPKVTDTKVNSIGAILDGMEASQLRQVVRQLVEVSKQSGVSIGTVYIVGGAINFFDQRLMEDIQEHGGRVQYAPFAPYSLGWKGGVKWVVGTERGQHLIEGGRRLSRYVSSSGVFREPSVGEKAILTGPGIGLPITAVIPEPVTPLLPSVSTVPTPRRDSFEVQPELSSDFERSDEANLQKHRY